MWFNILKDSKQVSRTVGSVDWGKEEIPDEEEDNCNKKLKEYHEKAKKHGKKLENVSYTLFNPVPEKVACKAVEMIEEAKFPQSWKDEQVRIGDDEYWIMCMYDNYDKSRYKQDKVFLLLIRGPPDKSVVNVSIGTASEDLKADIDFR